MRKTNLFKMHNIKIEKFFLKDNQLKREYQMNRNDLMKLWISRSFQFDYLCTFNFLLEIVFSKKN